MMFEFRLQFHCHDIAGAARSERNLTCAENVTVTDTASDSITSINTSSHIIKVIGGI
jgi:hypothetical protein